MTVNDLKTIIENYAASKSLTYIRATEIEANFNLDQVDPAKRVMIHYDQSELITGLSIGSLIVLQVPTQILFLKYDPEPDSQLDVIDDGVELCEKDALMFFNMVQRSNLFTNIVDLEPPSLERIPAFKRFDAAFSGVLLNCVLPIITDNNCYGFPYTFPYPLS